MRTPPPNINSKGLGTTPPHPRFTLTRPPTLHPLARPWVAEKSALGWWWWRIELEDTIEDLFLSGELARNVGQLLWNLLKALDE